MRTYEFSGRGVPRADASVGGVIQRPSGNVA